MKLSVIGIGFCGLDIPLYSKSSWFLSILYKNFKINYVYQIKKCIIAIYYVIRSYLINLTLVFTHG